MAQLTSGQPAVPHGPISPRPPQLKPPAPKPAKPHVSLNAQQVATQTVGRELAPILANINTQNQQDTAGRSAAITQATNELAGLYKQYASAPSPYDPAVADASKVEDYLTNRLTQGGHDQAANLSSVLQGIGGSTGLAKSLADQAASYGSGLGTTNAGLSSAGLEQLLGDRASRADYAAKLPANAALYGLQAERGLQGEEAKNLSDALAAIENQRPSLINTVTGQIQSNNAKKAALAQSAAALGLPDPTLSGKYGYAVDKTGKPVGGKVTPLPGYTVTGDGTVTKTPKPVVKKAPTVDNTLSKAKGYLVDTHGNAILRAGKKQPFSPGTTSGGLSNADRRALLTDLNKWTGNVKPGKQFNSKTQTWMNVPGTGSKPLPYTQVIQNLTTSYGLSKQEAEKYANAKYKPGQHGRPYPVAPPNGTEPLSPTEVIDQRGGIYKLVNGKWVPQTTKAADYPALPNG